MPKKAEIPEMITAETADQKLAVLRRINQYGEAVCGSCGAHLVNVEERIKCKFCWNCGKPVRWK